jgi:hypothetical protein
MSLKMNGKYIKKPIPNTNYQLSIVNYQLSIINYYLNSDLTSKFVDQYSIVQKKPPITNTQHLIICNSRFYNLIRLS